MKLDLLILIIVCFHGPFPRYIIGVCTSPPEHTHTNQPGGHLNEEQQIPPGSHTKQQQPLPGLLTDQGIDNSYGAQDAKENNNEVAPTADYRQEGSRVRQQGEKLLQESDTDLLQKSNTGEINHQTLEILDVPPQDDAERNQKSERVTLQPVKCSSEDSVVATLLQAAEKTIQGVGTVAAAADDERARDGNDDMTLSENTLQSDAVDKYADKNTQLDISSDFLLSQIPLQTPRDVPVAATLTSSFGDKTMQDTEHLHPSASISQDESSLPADMSSGRSHEMSGSSSSSHLQAGVEVDNRDLDVKGQQEQREASAAGTNGHKQTDEEDFLSFEEWRKKVLEEQEKEKSATGGDEDSLMSVVSPATSQKLRINYAAKSCGAKVVASNPEMENANHMLTVNRDEYMLNPCSAKKWFVVELCEPVAAKAVELASLELFSSQPRSFRVSLGDRYPTKDWLGAGLFEMTSEKVPQLFPLNVQSTYVKFVRVEMIDHYGSEHFCPVTLFRMFGHPIDDDSEEPATQTEPEEEETADGNGEAKNLFSRTKETVVNLVKKVLYKDDKPDNDNGKSDRGTRTAGFVREVDVHGNISEDILLPCEPDEEQRTGRKPTVDVHHLQPRIQPQQSQFADPSVSSVGDIPMVTKLGDGDQIENKRGSVGVSGGDQGFVTLIQSGNGAIWDAALRHCYLQSAPDAELCSYTSLCRYIQIMLGETPPFSHPQPSSLKLSSSLVHTPWTSHSTSVSSSNFSSVTAGSAAATSIIDDQSSFVVEGSSIITATSSLLEPSPTVDDTLSGMQPRQEDDSRERSVQDTGGHGVEQLDLPGKERRTDTTAASQHVTSSSWQDGSDNDPSLNKHSSLVRTRESTLDNGISDNPSSAYNTFDIQDHSMHSLPAHDQDTEILEPSIQLETTTVSSAAELMRPTPVLEMSRASIERDKKASEVRETAMPGVKPSPISSLVDENAGDESVSLYPQTLAPSVEGATAGGSAQMELGDSLANSGSGVTTSTPHNVTDKKSNDLDLVHIPLSISAKRETAIMRLTNRIKALELNVSLSSRFLDELSTRFKKQNDDLMKMLNKTISHLNMTTTSSQQQNEAQEEQILLLETRLENLTVAVQHLSDRFDSFTEQTTQRQMLSLTFDFILLVIILMTLLRSIKPAPVHPDVRLLLDTMPHQPLPPSTRQRHNSDRGVIKHTVAEKGPGLKKGGSEANLMSIYKSQLACPVQDCPVTRKKKRKKNKVSKESSVDLQLSPGHCSQEASLTTAAGLLFGLSAGGVHGEGGGSDNRASISKHRRWGSDSGNMAATHAPDIIPVASDKTQANSACSLSSANCSTPQNIPQCSFLPPPISPSPLPLPPPPPPPPPPLPPPLMCFKGSPSSFEQREGKINSVKSLPYLADKSIDCTCPTEMATLGYPNAGKRKTGSVSGGGACGESVQTDVVSKLLPDTSQLKKPNLVKLACLHSTQPQNLDEKKLSCPHGKQQMNESKLVCMPVVQTSVYLSKGNPFHSTIVCKNSLHDPKGKKEAGCPSALNGENKSSETKCTTSHWPARGGTADSKGRGMVRTKGNSGADGHFKKSAQTK